MVDDRRCGGHENSVSDFVEARLNGGNRVCPKRRSDVTRHTVDGEAVILDRQSQQIHQLNQSGSFIWDQCDGQTPISEIIRCVTDQFDVEHDVAAADVNRAVEELRKIGLLVIDSQ